LDISKEYPHLLTGVIKDVKAVEKLTLVDSGTLNDHVAAAAASTRYFPAVAQPARPNAKPTLTFNDNAQVIPANYRVKITYAEQRAGAAPDASYVTVYDGANTGSYLYLSGDAMSHSNEVWLDNAGGCCLQFYGALAATTTYDNTVSFEVYLVEKIIVETSELTP